MIAVLAINPYFPIFSIFIVILKLYLFYKNLSRF